MPQPAHDPFKAIADPTRREILLHLTKETYTINDLAAFFKTTRQCISKHLTILTRAGFITIQAIGKQRHCLILPEGFEYLQQWLSFFHIFLGSKHEYMRKSIEKKAGQTNWLDSL